MEKVLSDSELENISGGVGISSCHFSGQVDPHACVAGRSYYVVMGAAWFYGVVDGIINKDGGELLKLRASQWNGSPCTLNCELSLQKITVYTKMAVDC